jgi:hypothetical protein
MPSNIKICYIIFSLVTLAKKLTELDGRTNNNHFLNFKDSITLISNFYAMAWVYHTNSTSY